MFLKEGFILGNELIQKMEIHLANLGNLRLSYDDACDNYNIRRMNNCMMLNSKCKKLPKTFKRGIERFKSELTDMSDKLPCTYIHKEFKISEKQLFEHNIVIDKINVANRNLYVFNPVFVKKLRNNIPYILDGNDFKECSEQGILKGAIQITSNKYFVWY